MSSTEGEGLKAGHPPAVKAGGMRVVSRHRHEEVDADAYDKKYVDSLPNPPGAVESASTVSGAPVKGNADFTADGLKPAHVKPVPTVQVPHTQKQKKIQIHQPRK